MNNQYLQKKSGMLQVAALAIMVVAMWSLSVSPVSAQGPGQVQDRALADLEQTDQIMEKAREAVRESGSQRATALLENATALQQQAWEQYRGRMYGYAQSQTLRAREKAMEAIAATRGPEENENAVARQLERTDEILEGMRGRLGEWGGRGQGMRSQSSDSQFESLVRRQQLAWQHYHERRLRASLKLTLQVREQAAQMTQQARRFRHRPANIEGSLERMGEYLGRAREPVMESGPARNIEMFQRAERRYAEAKEAFQAGQMSVAREHLRVCRELVDRALLGVEGTSDPKQIEELIQQARTRWERLETRTIESGDKALMDLHRSAGEYLERAQNQLRQQKTVQALTQVRAAVGLLNQVEDALP